MSSVEYFFNRKNAAMSGFVNKYTHRTATKESTCWVCGKFTTAVLTSNDQDWFYVCLNHINDISFCKPIAPPTATATPPAPVAATSLKSNAASGKKDEKSDAKKDGNETKKDEKSGTSSVTTPAAELKPATPTGPKQYILDTKIFFLREDYHRKKKMAQQAKQVTAQLPSVPRNPF